MAGSPSVMYLEGGETARDSDSAREGLGMDFAFSKKKAQAKHLIQSYLIMEGPSDKY